MSEKPGSSLDGLWERLRSEGISPSQEKLYVQALTHKSFSGNGEGHNEKLEFLGDAVLDLAMADLLMRRFPDNDEGRLSKKRASLVNELGLSRVGSHLGLSSYLRLGKSELQSQGAQKPRLIAGCFEALVGAIYLDQGYLVVQAWIEKQFAEILAREDIEKDFITDFKTRFQELAQATLKQTPVYQVVGEMGPSHARVFVVQVKTENEVWGEASGNSKKVAEQAAAEKALEVLSKRNEEKV